MNVLIVEDNPISARVLENVLRKHGYETLVARDGLEGLELLESRAEVDLVISDIVMPNSNGVEFLRTLRSRAEWRELPVIVCTSMKPEEFRDSAGQGEEFRYISKPIHAGQVIEKVAEAAARHVPVLQPCDLTMARIGMNAHEFLDLLDEFETHVNAVVEALEASRPGDRPVEVRELYEGARLLGADRVVGALDRLEKTSAGRDSAMAQGLYKLLLRELKAVRYCLRSYAARDPRQFAADLGVAPDGDPRHPQSCGS